MKVQKFLSDFKNTKATNNFLRLLVLVLTGTVIVEGTLMLKMMDKQKVIVVPLNIDRKFSVTGTTASPEYIEMMVRQSIYLKENFTPETVKENFEAFLTLISPDYYHQVETDLLAQAEKYARYHVSQVFFIKDIVIRKNNTAEVKGIRKTFVSDKLVKQESTALRIAFRVKNGRFEVTGYEEVAKNGSA
jgi:conjugal transfer pilus assembly protein TraE